MYNYILYYNYSKTITNFRVRPVLKVYQELLVRKVKEALQDCRDYRDRHLVPEREALQVHKDCQGQLVMMVKRVKEVSQVFQVLLVLLGLQDLKDQKVYQEKMDLKYDDIIILYSQIII